MCKEHTSFFFSTRQFCCQVCMFCSCYLFLFSLLKKNCLVVNENMAVNSLMGQIFFFIVGDDFVLHL